MAVRAYFGHHCLNMKLPMPSILMPDGISDRLPAIQGRLGAYGIARRVYRPGTWPTGRMALNDSVPRAWRNG